MTEELKNLLNQLSEEDQKSFIEKAKVQLQNSVKMAAEKKKKEEQKKQFKASGHWETQTEEKDSKITLDITEDNKKEIIFDFNEGDISFALTKKEFFNFYKLLTDAYNSLKENSKEDNDDATGLFSDEMIKTIKEIADSVYSSSCKHRRPFRDKIFYIR